MTRSNYPFETNVLTSPRWLALQAFDIDPSGAQLTFVKRLARENCWPVEFAQRVLAEYKKFVFLAVTAGHGVTPSDQVDQAWHLHLTYTESYWTELCGNLLQQPLHHGPTKGGQQEDDKYFDGYSRTLESYERIFGHQPPADIWPAPERRFDARLRFARLDTSGYWLLKKPVWPGFNARRTASYAGMTLLMSLTLSACTSQVSGGAFLFVGAITAFIFFIGFAIYQSRQNQPDKKQAGESGGGDGCSSDVSGCGSNHGSGADHGSGGESSGCGSSGCSSSGCGGGGCSS